MKVKNRKAEIKVTITWVLLVYADCSGIRKSSDIPAWSTPRRRHERSRL